MAKKTQRTNEEVKQAIIKVMEARTSNVETNKCETPDSVNTYEHQIKLLEDKLDKIIELLEKPKQVNQTNLSEMSLTDLNYLKEHLNRNILMNNYPGGDSELKVSSNNLIIKIGEEINKRINQYK